MSEQTGSGGLNEYIQHHLHQNTIEVAGGAFHIDSWVVSLVLGLAFIAWFGPRGLNSLLFALLVVAGDVPEGEFLLAVWLVTRAGRRTTTSLSGENFESSMMPLPVTPELVAELLKQYQHTQSDVPSFPDFPPMAPEVVETKPKRAVAKAKPATTAKPSSK